MATLVQVEKNRLQRMCQATISGIEKLREEEKQEVVESRLRFREKLRKVLRFLKPLDREKIYADEEARSQEEGMAGFSAAFTMANWRGWGTYGVAQRLQRAAELSNQNDVLVDADDLFQLWRDDN